MSDGRSSGQGSGGGGGGDLGTSLTELQDLDPTSVPDGGLLWSDGTEFGFYSFDDFLSFINNNGGPFAESIDSGVTTARFMGASSGVPTTGTFALNDVVIDPAGYIYVCTTAGTDSGAAWATIEAVDTSGFIPKTTLSTANSVMYATATNTPAQLAMGASTILARLASGNIVAATVSQIKTLLGLGVADVSGAAPLASPTFTGTVTVPTPSNTTDATTKTYVDTADGLNIPKTTLNATNTVMYATTANTPAPLTMGASTILARLASGNIVAATVAQIKTLLAIALADVSGVAAFPETVTAKGNAGSAQTIPAITATTTYFTYTLNSASCTFTMPTAIAGASFTVSLAYSGAYSPTFTGVQWAGSAAPSAWTATSGKTDIVTFFCVDGTHWIGTSPMLNVG